MASYRVVMGYGQLARDPDTKDYGQMPEGLTVFNQAGTNDCIHQLTKRFGAGIDATINRNRNNNYLQDIGYREFTSATSGMYDLDVTVNGAFVPEMSDWLEYAFMSDTIVIKKASLFTNAQGVVIDNPTQTTQGHVKNGDATHGYTVSVPTILYADYQTYFKKFSQEMEDAESTTLQALIVGGVYEFVGTTVAPSTPGANDGWTNGHFYLITSNTSGTVTKDDLGTDYTEQDSMEYHVNQYTNMDGPKYFDIGYSQINENTTNGSYNEIGVLLGCVIDSFSINYESGSDAQVKFSLSIVALNEEVYITDDYFDYNAIMDYAVPLQPLVAGCVSVFDGTNYVTIAQTDSQGITLNNNLTKLGNCLKLTYSGVALGALGIEMNLSTYANDPNKVFTYMYGYTQMEDGGTYAIAKQPKPISKMKIRSDNTSSILKVPTQMVDINLTDTYVGSANRTYNVDNALMDEPDLRPRRVQIVVGFAPQSS